MAKETHISGTFTLVHQEDRGGPPKEVGTIDGVLIKEIEPSTSVMVFGDIDSSTAKFCLEWFTGGASGRWLRFTEVNLGQYWEGTFLPRNVTNDVATFLSRGQVVEG